MHGKVALSGNTIQVAIGATVSNSVVLSGNMDDNSNCKAGIINFLTLKQEEVTQLQDHTNGGVCQDEGVDRNNHHRVFQDTTEMVDKSLVDSLEGTMVWDYDSVAYPRMVVQLYEGLIKIYMNQANILEGSTAVVECKEKG